MKTELKWIEHKQKYYQFLTHLRRNWINVLFHEQVRPIVQEFCDRTNEENYITDEKPPVGSEKQANIRLTAKNLFGFGTSSTGAGSEWAFEWTLVSSITLFEAFTNDIAELIYYVKPTLLSPVSLSASDLANKIEKHLNNVFRRPSFEAFVKYNGTTIEDGEFKLETGEYLDEKCKNELLCYIEICQRRNVIVHNGGTINEKYIKNVPNNHPNKLNLGDKVKIDRGYLFESIKALYRLARFYTIKAVHTAYKTGDSVKDAELLHQLEREFK